MMQYLFPSFLELMPLTIAQEFAACVAACACLCYVCGIVQRLVHK